MPNIIFAIDNDTDPAQVARFERHLMSLQALGKLSKPARFCIGQYEGHLERSYCLDVEDFNNDALHIAPFASQQESYLIASADQSILLYANSGKAVILPPMICVGRSMPDARCWTFFHDTGEFWVTAGTYPALVLNLPTLEASAHAAPETI